MKDLFTCLVHWPDEEIFNSLHDGSFIGGAEVYGALELRREFSVGLAGVFTAGKVSEEGRDTLQQRLRLRLRLRKLGLRLQCLRAIILTKSENEYHSI